MTLIAGGNASVPHSTLIVRIKSGGDADVSAFRLYADGKTRVDDDFVFYGQKNTRDNTIQFLTEEQNATFAILLPSLSNEVEKVSFTVTVDNGRRVASLNMLTISIEDQSGLLIDCPVSLNGRSEVALILGELYKRNEQWKFRFVDQGFNGGLQPLAEHYGVEIENSPPSSTTETSTVPSSSPVNLSKITLTKQNPSINLTKSVNLSKSEGFGRIRVNLNWNQDHRQPTPKKFGGLFGGLNRTGSIDLDLGAFIRYKGGDKFLIQALGDAFGHYENYPYIQLEADDRTGAKTDGEWININGAKWDDIDEVIIFTFIYDGVPNWAATDGIVTLYIPHQPPIETRLTEGDNSNRMCAIAHLKNVNNTIQVERLDRYFDGHKSIDSAYGWGFRWQAGRK